MGAQTEFASGAGGDWRTIGLPAPPGTQAEIDAELQELYEIAEFRAGVMAEAMEQRDNVLGYFRGLLTFKGGTHPWTVRALPCGDPRRPSSW